MRDVRGRTSAALAAFTLSAGVLASLFSADLANAQAPTPKVAVIVSSGDLGQLEDSMKSVETRAIQTYEKLGFKVIVIGGVNKTGKMLSPEVFQQTLAELKGVSDLRLDFIGHGGLAKVKDDYPAKALTMSRERMQNTIDPIDPEKPGKLVWVASNSQTADVQYFGQKALELGGKPLAAKPIDHEQIVRALDKFHRNNPDTVATLNLLNCFSGAIAQRLRLDPKTIVYGNSPHNTIAMDIRFRARDARNSKDLDAEEGLKFLRSSNGLGEYYSAIAGNAPRSEVSPSSNIFSFDGARLYANSTVKRLLQSDPSAVYLVGRSPQVETVIGWCEAGSPGRLRSPVLQKEPHEKVLADLAMEMTFAKDAMIYAEIFPSKANPLHVVTEDLKAEHARCLKNATKREASPRGGKTTARTLRDLYKDDPKKPFRLLFATYRRALENPAVYPEIVRRFKASILTDEIKLKEMNLPYDRWGEIKKLIVSTRDGTLSDALIIARIKLQFEKLNLVCVLDNSPETTCTDDQMASTRNLGEYLLNVGPGKSDSIKLEKTLQSCAGKVDRFNCIYQQDPQSPYLPVELQRLWDSQEPQPPARASCGKDDWSNYLRAKKNIELDQKCVDDFIKFAPESERENLRRIQKLSERDARGYSPEIAPSAKGSATPGKVQR